MYSEWKNHSLPVPIIAVISLGIPRICLWSLGPAALVLIDIHTSSPQHNIIIIYDRITRVAPKDIKEQQSQKCEYNLPNLSILIRIF